MPGDPSKILRLADNPELAHMKGKTLVTTDGTTLLGADDKAGIAIIMEAASYLAQQGTGNREQGTGNREQGNQNLLPVPCSLLPVPIFHGDIRLCFTCDEEIGHGTDHLDLKSLTP